MQLLLLKRQEVFIVVTNIRVCEDDWLLAPDGVIDAGAVVVAANGLRLVRLTSQERRIATAVILVNGGTAETVHVNLGLPSLKCAEFLVSVMRHEMALWRLMLESIDLHEITRQMTAEILGVLDIRYVLHIMRST